MVVRLQILGGIEFAAKGYLQRAEARGRRLLDRRLLARRDEVGHLGRQDLRRPDQQRDDGVHLERRHLQATPASIPTSRRRPGTTSSPTPSRSTTSSASPATAWSPARTPATRRSASCRSSGPTAAARSTRPRPTRPTRRSSQQRRQQGGAAGLLRHVRARQVGAGLGADQHRRPRTRSRSSPASSAMMISPSRPSTP